MNKVILVYHRKDMDGITSGAIARRYFKTQNYDIREIPFDYNDPFPEDIPDGSTIYFMDVVMKPYEKMTPLRNRCKVFVIDHHKTWIESPDAKNFLGLTSTEKSGCMLTWEYFYHDVEMPKMIEYLGRFDIWDHSDEELWKEAIVPMNLAALGQNVHPSIKRPGEPLDNFIDSYLNDYFKLNKESQEARIKELIAVGKQIWNYVYLDDAQTAKAAAMECTFDGKPAIVINSRRTSLVFDSVFDPARHYMMIVWYKSTKGYEVSLYCPDPSPEKDLSKIAEKFGGGGHEGACGFTADYIDFRGMRGIGCQSRQMIILKRDPETGNLYHPSNKETQFKQGLLTKPDTPDKDLGSPYGFDKG